VEPNPIDAELMLWLYESLLLWLTWILSGLIVTGALISLFIALSVYRKLLSLVLLAIALPAVAQVPLGLDIYMFVPDDNPVTRAKSDLGRALFNDPVLSRDRSRSCASCHNPRRGFTDGRTLSRGVFNRQGARTVPTLINRGYGKSFFWDGRVADLEAQVLKPIQDATEMDMTLDDAVARLRDHANYRRQFREIFQRDVNATDLSRALASYVRTIVSGNSAVDRYLNGDRGALSAEERLGLNVFRGKGNCTTCHMGPNFTDERFHNTGVAWRNGRLRDVGRFAVTGTDSDRGSFKTPTLREIARTAPYMHDGSFRTLADVVNHYDRGGIPNPYLDTELHPLHLTAQEKRALVAFLRALSD
jgi:cytochrome c peroxidase